MKTRVKINVIIPMAGEGSRFSSFGFTRDKFLLPIDAYSCTPMIEGAITTLGIKNDFFDCTFIFIIREKEGEGELRQLLKKICHNENYKCIILTVKELTEGPASTSYCAKEFIDNEIPLVISNSDQLLDWNFGHFYKTAMKYDGCVLTYKPHYNLIFGKADKHSFVRLGGETGTVPVEFSEKVVISDNALVGVHFYKTGKTFLDSFETMVAEQLRAPNGEFYLSGTYQCLLKDGKSKLGICKLRDTEFYHPVGEPADYFEYYNQRTPFFVTPVVQRLGTMATLLNTTIKNLSSTEGEMTDAFNEDFPFFEFDLNRLPEKRRRGGSGEESFWGEEGIGGGIQADNGMMGEEKRDSSVSNSLQRYVVFYDNCLNNEITYSVFSNPQSLKKINEHLFWMKTHSSDYSTLCLMKTGECKVEILNLKKGEKCPFYYNDSNCEINLILKGQLRINGKTIYERQTYIVKKNVIVCPEILQNCRILSIKMPWANSKIYI